MGNFVRQAYSNASDSAKHDCCDLCDTMCTCPPECPAKPSHMSAAVMLGSLDETSHLLHRAVTVTYLNGILK